MLLLSRAIQLGLPLENAHLLDVDLDNENGNFLRGKFISTKQVDSGIPVYDESNEGLELIEALTKEDIPKSNLAFSISGYFFDPSFTVLQTKRLASLFFYRGCIVNKNPRENIRGGIRKAVVPELKKPGN